MMQLFLNWEYDERPQEETEVYFQLFEKVLKAGLVYEKVDFDVEISLTVTTADEVQAMNRDYRNLDQTTDVLSFPLIDYTDMTVNEALALEEPDPETENVVLGDIVINYERAVSQAEEYGHSTERELAFLAVHSLLHLLGYDHMEEDEEADMRRRQREILESCELGR